MGGSWLQKDISFRAVVEQNLLVVGRELELRRLRGLVAPLLLLELQLALRRVEYIVLLRRSEVVVVKGAHLRSAGRQARCAVVAGRELTGLHGSDFSARHQARAQLL